MCKVPRNDDSGDNISLIALGEIAVLVVWWLRYQLCQDRRENALHSLVTRLLAIDAK